MRYAAIDIGSNAIRLLISEIIETKEGNIFKKISLTRIPLRLGEEAFLYQEISKKTTKNFINCMKAFKYIMDASEVTDFRACATSAMREAKNGDEIRALVKEKTGIKIDIISGTEEAEIIFSNFHLSQANKEKTYLYIDVGGGSTEVSLIKNNQRVASKSFKLGTVRLLNNKVDPKLWQESKDWIKALTDDEDEVIAIGTGGNINRIYKETRHQFNERVSYSDIKQVIDYIGLYDYEERIQKLKLKPDRADVIIPAGKIYLHMMKSAFAHEMIVPKVGLSDGIIYNLYLKNKQ